MIDSKKEQEPESSNILKEFKQNFYHTIKETCDYIDSMIDNLFREKQKKYFEESLKETSRSIPRDVAKIIANPPVSSSNEIAYSQENRENVDPLNYLLTTAKTSAKNERINSQDAEIEAPKKEILKEEDANKEKPSLLSRIQNSLKDLTSYSNEKSHQTETTSNNREEKLRFIDLTSKNIEEKYLENNENELKPLIQLKQNSLLNLKMSNVKSIFLQNKKKTNVYDIRSFINVSKMTIKFGNVLPGYIMEDDLEIQNKSSQNLSIKVLVVCHNSELDEHDEYIYSIRKLNIYDYNEKIVSVIPPHNAAKYKIALKVPNLKSICALKGSVIITVQGAESNLTLPVSSYVEIPEIFCPKEIYDNVNSCSIIKFALKKGKKQDCKIPFKNNSNLNLCLEFEFIEPDGKKTGYDLLTYPSSINVGGNGIGILNVILKPIIQIQQQDAQNLNEIRRVLLAKIKNSSMIYYFPLSIEIY